MEKYNLIGKSIYDYDELPEWDENEKRYNDFVDRLKNSGINPNTDIFIQFVGEWRKSDSLHSLYGIDEIIECLAIKDGIDYVLFNDGKYGIVAYYNGRKDIAKIISNVPDDWEECEECEC